MHGEKKNGRNHAALLGIYFLSLLFTFYLKLKTLEDEGGFRIVSRMYGQAPEMMSFLQKLDFYTADVIVLLLLVPLAITGIGYIASPQLYARCWLIVSLFLIGISFVNLNVLGATGKFFSVDQLAPMLAWARERPDMILDYLSLSALAKLGIAVSIVIFLYRARDAQLFGLIKLRGVLFALALLMVSTSLFASVTDNYPRTRFHDSVIIQMISSMLMLPNYSKTTSATVHTKVDLKYSCGSDGVYSTNGAVGKKRNIILFIMETVPADLFQVASSGLLRSFTELSSHAIVATNHYTTYPFTSYARFSIFTGLYPSYRIEKTLPLGAKRRFHSVFSNLHEAGYEFTVFDPVSQRYPVDDWVVEQMGGHVVSTNVHGNPADKDLDVLRAMLSAVKRSAKSGQPFIYAFVPQITHGPWLAYAASKAQLYEEGLRRLRILDANLESLIVTLKQQGVYENTVILITSDHGLRTKKEASYLKTLVLDRTSYHVPFVLHDPRLTGRVELAKNTSHIDISPTIQCLYADQGGSIETQGVAMSAPDARRELFFGGSWYMGSDGMLKDDYFYSFNRQLNMLWKSHRFEFDKSRPEADLGMDQGIVARLDEQLQIQEFLLSSRLRR